MTSSTVTVTATDATVTCAIESFSVTTSDAAVADAQVTIKAMRPGTLDHGSLTGLADNDHPQYVLDAGDTMTGELVVERSTATATAVSAKKSTDTGKRFWVDASGTIGWDPVGSSSTPRVTLSAWDGNPTGGVAQFWLTCQTEDTGFDFNVFCVAAGRNAAPVIVLQSYGGTTSSPTATTTGTRLGEIAYRGCASSTPTPGLTATGIAGWSGATVSGWAVENWSAGGGGAVGGGVTIETVKRSSGIGRQQSVVVFDGGQLVLDPANGSTMVASWTLPSARLTVVSQATTETTAVLKAAASQTAKVLEVQNSSGTVQASISATGVAAFAASSTVGGSAIVVTSDARLSDTRTPTDGSVTDAKVASNAAIALSKLAQPAQAAIAMTAWSLYA